MLPYFTRDQIRAALPYAQLIPALSDAFSCEIIAPKRHAHTLSEENSSTLLMMPVWQEQGMLGVKLVTVAPHNKTLPSVHAIFMLFDTTTGAPLAIMDGEELTLRRTAATSALASSFTSRAESEHLVLVGNGFLAPHLAVAHCQTRRITTISVWGRSIKKSQICADIIRKHPELPANVKINCTEDLEAVCKTADIISCATTSKTPIVCGHWIKPGTHIDLVGGFKPDMREVDDDLIKIATVFVDTFDGALAEAGDLLQPLANGNLQRRNIVAELADLCTEKHSGRADERQITVFKSVGSAIEDLCAANLVWSTSKPGKSK